MSLTPLFDPDILYLYVQSLLDGPVALQQPIHYHCIPNHGTPTSHQRNPETFLTLIKLRDSHRSRQEKKCAANDSIDDRSEGRAPTIDAFRPYLFQEDFSGPAN